MKDMVPTEPYIFFSITCQAVSSSIRYLAVYTTLAMYSDLDHFSIQNVQSFSGHHNFHLPKILIPLAT